MFHRYLVAAAILGAAATPISAQSVKAGIEAWERADYSAAVAIWRPLAEKGDADAAFNLGQAYRLGRGVPANASTAKDWFERAANQGQVAAETTLGLLLFQDGDQAAGLRWLKAAAERGEPRAQLVYGTALINGDAVTQDAVLGYAFVSRAAAQGLAPAQATLAQLDQMMTPEDRKKGAALAAVKVRASPLPAPTRSTKARPAKPAQAASAAPKAAPKPAPTKASSVAVSGPWRIQLGAFSQRVSAEALYRKLSASSTIANHSVFYVPAGAVTRVQVGPFATRAAAEAACGALKGQPCFPVAAPK